MLSAKPFSCSPVPQVPQFAVDGGRADDRDLLAPHRWDFLIFSPWIPRSSGHFGSGKAMGLTVLRGTPSLENLQIGHPQAFFVP